MSCSEGLGILEDDSSFTMVASTCRIGLGGTVVVCADRELCLAYTRSTQASYLYKLLPLTLVRYRAYDVAPILIIICHCHILDGVLVAIH